MMRGKMMAAALAVTMATSAAPAGALTLSNGKTCEPDIVAERTDPGPDAAPVVTFGIRVDCPGVRWASSFGWLSHRSGVLWTTNLYLHKPLPMRNVATYETGYRERGDYTVDVEYTLATRKRLQWRRGSPDCKRPTRHRHRIECESIVSLPAPAG